MDALAAAADIVPGIARATNNALHSELSCLLEEAHVDIEAAARRLMECSCTRDVFRTIPLTDCQERVLEVLHKVRDDDASQILFGDRLEARDLPSSAAAHHEHERARRCSERRKRLLERWPECATFLFHQKAARAHRHQTAESLFDGRPKHTVYQQRNNLEIFLISEWYCNDRKRTTLQVADFEAAIHAVLDDQNLLRQLRGNAAFPQRCSPGNADHGPVIPLAALKGHAFRGLLRRFGIYVGALFLLCSLITYHLCLLVASAIPRDSRTRTHPQRCEPWRLLRVCSNRRRPSAYVRSRLSHRGLAHRHWLCAASVARRPSSSCGQPIAHLVVGRFISRILVHLETRGSIPDRLGT